jgi:hypothetical protein
MAYYAVQYTLTATAAALSTIFSGVTHAKQIHIRAGAANANALYVGGSGVTNVPANAGDYTGPIATAPDPIHLGPFDANPIALNSVYIVGTAAQIAHIQVVT